MPDDDGAPVLSCLIAEPGLFDWRYRVILFIHWPIYQSKGAIFVGLDPESEGRFREWCHDRDAHAG